ncbi:hypothetical protein HanRHA438_Chr14g0634531 [Helianthus annuus]|nr:hypothetical protein HanRHA438_Chr14g0634531 [Helianthus annuus]
MFSFSFCITVRSSLTRVGVIKPDMDHAITLLLIDESIFRSTL